MPFAGVTKVFVVRDNVAHQIPVRTGTRGTEGFVEIAEGVFADEFVITSGFSKLEDGLPVSIQKTEAAPTAGAG